MSEIDKDTRFDDSRMMMEHQVPHHRRHGGASDTSFESMMEDSPSKYDQQNQRYSLASAPDGAHHNLQRSARWAAGGLPDNIEEEPVEDGHESRRRRKRKQKHGYIVEEITGRDIQLATAYGGVAKPRVRKVPTRFTTMQRQERVGL